MKQAFIFLFLVIAIQACEFNVSTASLSDIKICTELASDECTASQTTIDANVPYIYATAQLKNVPTETEITISWQYDNQGSWYEIDLVKLKTDNSTTIKSSLSAPTNGWPKGNYKVIFSLNTDNSTPVEVNFSIP